MGRKSVRDPRRLQITQAFCRVLADHGYAGATISAVAAEAGVSPGLLHHHFRDKRDMLDSVLRLLSERWLRRVSEQQGDDSSLGAYLTAALERTDDVTSRQDARCWVGVFAEAMRDRGLYERLRSLLHREIQAIVRRSGGTLSRQRAAAVLAFVVGALVLGAFEPAGVAGFALPAIRHWLGEEK